VEGFKQLVVWQKAYEMALAVYRATTAFPRSELYGLASQMQRAAVSVPANIAEGYERQHRREYLQFLAVARGSLAEVETYLMPARDLHYIDESTFRSLEAQRAEVGRMLRGLVNSLSNDQTGRKPSS